MTRTTYGLGDDDDDVENVENAVLASSSSTTSEEEERRAKSATRRRGTTALAGAALLAVMGPARERRERRGIGRGFVETRPGTDAHGRVRVLVRVLLGRRHLGVRSDADAVRRRDGGRLRVRRRAERLREF